MDPEESEEGGLYWIAPSHTHTARGIDWYWGLAIIALGGIGLCVWFDNLIFALVIGLAALCLALVASRGPRECEVIITPRGISIDHETYTFEDLHSFWIHERHPVHPKLYLATRGILHPHLAVIIEEGIDPQEVRRHLGRFVPEEPGHSLATFFAERLGL